MPARNAPAPPPSGPQRALAKLGLLRDIDLALHLPLRYEDETRLDRLRDARDGDSVQIEATVADCKVEYRPRRQLLVRMHDDDGEPNRPAPSGPVYPVVTGDAGQTPSGTPPGADAGGGRSQEGA